MKIFGTTDEFGLTRIFFMRHRLKYQCPSVLNRGSALIILDTTGWEKDGMDCRQADSGMAGFRSPDQLALELK